MQTFDYSLFIDRRYFNNDGAQLYLIFEAIYKFVTTFSGLPNIISEWESKRLSNGKFRTPYTANKVLSPKLVWMNNSRIRLRFEGSCIKQEDTAYSTPSHLVNLFIVHELDSFPSDLKTDFTLGDCLFGSVELATNADPDKYSYSGYGIGFQTRRYHSLPDGNIGKNFTIFGVNMSSSVHIDKKGKDILILGEESTQGLNHKSTSEPEYSINFTRPGIKFCLSLHYNEGNSLLMLQKSISSKQKILK